MFDELTMLLTSCFFARDAVKLAQALLGKVLRVRHGEIWLSAMIIETEAYYKAEKGSHASLGYTEKRKALFMFPGTIYMYHARGGDSLNISAQGEGNAVLIKSGVPYTEDTSEEMLVTMQRLNPHKNRQQLRSPQRLCSGQTLLCKALGLKVKEWDQKNFDPERFYIDDVSYHPHKIIQTTRLGIPKGRDEHLLYRFIDYDFALYCTDNPLRKNSWQEGKHYHIS